MSDDSPLTDEQKKLQKEFFEKSLEAQEAERKRLAEKAEEHAGEKTTFLEQGALAVSEQEAETAVQKRAAAAYRKKQEEEQAALEADKTHKAALAAELQAEAEAKKHTEEEQAAYMKSLHEASVRKMLEERAERDCEEKRVRRIAEAESQAQQKKMTLQTQERNGKQEIEREMIQKSDMLERETIERKAKLHSTEIRKRMQIESEARFAMHRPTSVAGLGSNRIRAEQEERQKLAILDREMNKERSELENFSHREKRSYEQEAIRKKSDLERVTREGILEADRELAEAKRTINVEAEKERKGL